MSKQMLELADWLLYMQRGHEASMCANDPAIRGHIEKLKAWETALRCSAVSEQPLTTVLCNCPGCGQPHQWREPFSAIPQPVCNEPQASAESAQPLRRCGMCMTWNSKPCGEQCGWSPDDPTPEQAKAKDLKEKRRHNRKHPLPVTFE